MQLYSVPSALCVALAALLCASPAWADSTSSVSSTVSTSVGSVSDSLQTSSNSSSGKKEVAQGPYTVLEIEAIADKPDMLRVRLQAATPEATDTFFLLLPRATAVQAQLAPGQIITAQKRPYGLAFSSPGSKPFFLVMQDTWMRDIESRPVTL